MLDVQNFPDLGAAAIGVGRIDLAERTLSFSLPRYPGRAGDIHLNLVLVHLRRGYAALARGRAQEAAVQADEAERELGLVPPGWDREASRQRRSTLEDLRAKASAASGHTILGREGRSPTGKHEGHP
jgi:hypothetical protein